MLVRWDGNGGRGRLGLREAGFSNWGLEWWLREGIEGRGFGVYLGT